MAKRRKSRAVVAATWVEWTPDLEVYFSLPGADWRRPSKCRVVRSRRGFTITGKFIAPSGMGSTLTTRVAVQDGAIAHIVNETLKTSFGVRAAS